VLYGAVVRAGWTLARLPGQVPALLGAGAFLLALLAFPWATVVVVGIWRSAGRYPGPPLVALSARAAVAAGTMLLLYRLAVGALGHTPAEGGAHGSGVPASVVTGVILAALALGLLQALRDKHTQRPAVAPATPAQPGAADAAPVPECPIPANVAVGIRFRDGVACLAYYLIAQFVAALVVAFIAVGRTGAHATKAATNAEVLRQGPTLLLLSMVAGAAALILFLRRLSRRCTREVLWSELGLGWGTRRASLLALAGGVSLAALYVALALLVAPHTPMQRGFIARIAESSLTGRLSWVVTAVFMAGPAEEVLFRGVLLGAFRTVARASVAGLASGFVFWLLHLPEIAGFWPAAVCIALLAALTTTVRLRGRAVGPAIAAHVGYNGVLAMIALCAL
jgi:hypothetical protein